MSESKMARAVTLFTEFFGVEFTPDYLRAETRPEIDGTLSRNRDFWQPIYR